MAIMGRGAASLIFENSHKFSLRFSYLYLLMRGKYFYSVSNKSGSTVKNIIFNYSRVACFMISIKIRFQTLSYSGHH